MERIAIMCLILAVALSGCGKSMQEFVRDGKGEATTTTTITTTTVVPSDGSRAISSGGTRSVGSAVGARARIGTVVDPGEPKGNNSGAKSSLKRLLYDDD